MAGKGFVPGHSAPREKVKFTVSVRGRQWSSARHVQETLEEFARVIQRNARRLDFIGENDRIQRLQLARTDGSEPEELDVDATLEDVIICMGSKHLVAIVIPWKLAPALPCTRRREAEKLGPSSPMAIMEQFQQKSKLKNGLATPSSVRAVEETEPGAIDLEPSSVLVKRRAATCEPPVRGLKITIPSSDSTSVAPFHDERGMLASGVDGEHQAGPPQAALGSSSFDGVVLCKNGGRPVAHLNVKSTPSPAELAHFLVKGSSISPHRAAGVSDTNSSAYSQCFANATPIPGFQSFASALLSRLPAIPASTTVCGQPANNIAILAHFLASQLRAFLPGHCDPHSHSPPDSGLLFPFNNKVECSEAQEAAPNSSNNPVEISCCNIRDQTLQSSCLKNCGHIFESGLPNLTSKHANGSLSGHHDKDDSSSSANINIAAAPSNDVIKSERMHGRPELIFFVNRRSKTGIGAHHLKLSDLSVFFHLSVVDAAKKLGVSQTTLKKACRKFGLKRWPGRKVRSLESTIHGLEHTIAVGQGAGMEQLTEAYMRSEVTKLQQEMDHLVHGTLVQHSPVARTADLYKRLYSRGWRSKYHSSCPGLDLDLNIDSRTCENDLSLARGKVCFQKKVEIAALAVSTVDGEGVTHQFDTHGMQKPSDYKGVESGCQIIGGTTTNSTSTKTIAKSLGVQAVSRERLLGSCNPTGILPDHPKVATGNGTQNLAQDAKLEDIDNLEREHDLQQFEERSPKRPRLEVT